MRGKGGVKWWKC